MSDDLRGLFHSSDPEAVAMWNDICDKHESAASRWATYLRELGVKLAHPDDGWVTRKVDGSGSFHLSWYPLFDDKPQIGDLIAFGSPVTAPGAYGVSHYVPSGDHKKRWKGDFTVPPGEIEHASQGYRIVRVTKVERRSGILGYLQIFEYEDTGIRLPERPRKRHWWQHVVRRSDGDSDG